MGSSPGSMKDNPRLPVAQPHESRYDSVIAAVERFEENEQAMTPEACHRNAQRFSVPRFQAELRAAFLDTLALHGSGRF